MLLGCMYEENHHTAKLCNIVHSTARKCEVAAWSHVYDITERSSGTTPAAESQSAILLSPLRFYTIRLTHSTYSISLSKHRVQSQVSAIMTDAQNASKKEEDAPTGAKHTTNGPSSEPNKRQKVEKQATLEETLGQNDDDTKEEEDEPKVTTEETTEQPSKNESAVLPSEEKDVPSNILEKGIIYFFFRGRVNIEEPTGVKDVARSYILLRPIEKDAKLGEGPIGDAGNTRLLVLPKKVLPKSGRDRFMVFVEKSNTSFDELKKDFLAGEDYETKTAGTRHTPAPTPFGEGVYAITTTGRESHLAYILTLPEKPGDLQEEMGVKEKGSFIISSKNPNYEGPANAQLPEGPKYPKE